MVSRATPSPTRYRVQKAVHAMLNEFVIPYTHVRDREQGYAVSIVKAGLKAMGRPAGPVRPPLTDLNEQELEMVTDLVKKLGAGA